MWNKLAGSTEKEHHFVDLSELLQPRIWTLFVLGIYEAGLIICCFCLNMVLVKLIQGKIFKTSLLGTLLSGQKEREGKGAALAQEQDRDLRMV